VPQDLFFLTFIVKEDEVHNESAEAFKLKESQKTGLFTIA
jgi:hypothetical protein